MVTPQAPTFQSRMGDAADWDALADRTVAHFLAKSRDQVTTVYVQPGPADMPFAAAFRSVLEQKLHEKNLLVMQSAKGATVLRFSVQTFLYAKGNQKLPISYASFWTTLAALSVPLRQIASVDTGIAVAGVAGPLVDILASLADTTQAEVVLTVSEVNSDGRYLNYRDTSVFYVRPEELPFYWTHVADFTPQSRQADVPAVALSVRGDAR